MKGFLWSLSAFFFLLGCGSIDYLLKNPDYIALPAGMTVICAVLCIYFGYRAKTYDGRAIDRHHKLELKAYSADEAELIETSWQKAIADYTRVETARKTIRDGELREQLAVMQQVASNLLDYLEKHPKAIPAARRFIDTYQDRAANLAEEYRELEKTGLDTEQVADTRANIKETLFSFDEAYEKEFERVLGDKLLDMDAELAVLQKTMAADGIENLPEHEAKKPSATVQQDDEEKTTVLRDVRRLFDKKEPAVQRGTGLQNRGGRKHPRRRAFRAAETFRIAMPEELRGSVLKEKLIMSALAIFGGCIGAHKFYQGKTKWGILYLLFWWTAIPGIVGFFEGMRYLFMSMDDFYDMYYQGNRR